MNYVEEKAVINRWRIIQAILNKIDFLQILPAMVLLATGLFFIYGIGQQIGDTVSENFWKKQLFWIAIGLVFWTYLAFFFDYRKLKLLSIPLYVFTVLMLLAVLVFGTTINQAKRWISLGDIRFQPSEFAKVSLIIFNAWLFSLKSFKANKIEHLALAALCNAIPFFLIAVEPDLGTAVVIIPIIAAILFVAGLNWKWIVLAIAIFVAAVPISYPFLKDYQKERIKVFLDPGRDPENKGWNALQSQLAVGSGGGFGKGFMQGTQNTLGFLPQTVSKTDFIFSVIAEETGFAGALAILFMYIFLIFSTMRIGFIIDDNFARFIAVGVATVFFIHSFVNIGMTIRILPVKGLPLPLVSYGGSFMVSNLICLGILQSIYRLRKQEE